MGFCLADKYNTMAVPIWNISETVLGLARQSIFFKKSLTATDTINYSIVDGNLPSGVVINALTGMLSGTPDVTDPTPNTPIFIFTFTFIF